MSEFLTKYKAGILSALLCGAVLAGAVVAGAYDVKTASVAVCGMALFAVTVFEALSRRDAEKNITGRVVRLAANQDRITREVARTRGEVDGLKIDIARTASLIEQQDRNVSAPEIGETPRNRLQKILQKMATRPRARITVERTNDNAAQNRMVEELNDDTLLRAPRPADYSDAIVTELINHAVHNDRVEFFAQPIVRLPSRRLSYLEIFARIRARAGVYLPAGRYRPLAEKEILIADIDHLLLLHVLDALRADARRGVELGYFLNISANSLKDTAFISDLVEFLRRSRELAARLIFEVTQADYDRLTPQLCAVIEGLGRAGCRFSIDNIENPHMDVTRLQKLHVEFIKLDAAKLIPIVETSEGETLIARIREKLDDAGITMIVEKVENETELRKLLDIEMDYGEGYLFGKPDLEIAYRPKRVA